MLHSDDYLQSVNDTICWIMKGVNYLSGQTDVAKYLQQTTSLYLPFMPLSQSIQPLTQNSPQSFTSSHPPQPLPFPLSTTSQSVQPLTSQISPQSSIPPQSRHSPHPTHPSRAYPHSTSRDPTSPLSYPRPVPPPIIFEWDAYDLTLFKFWGCRIPPGKFLKYLKMFFIF